MKVKLHQLRDPKAEIGPHEGNTSLEQIRRLFRDLTGSIPLNYEKVGSPLRYTFTIGAHQDSELSQSEEGYKEKKKSSSHIGLELVYEKGEYTLTKFVEKSEKSSEYRKNKFVLE